MCIRDSLYTQFQLFLQAQVQQDTQCHFLKMCIGDSNYTLSDAKISGENNDGSKAFYVDDKDRNMTVAYNHNVLKLYYKSGCLLYTSRIQWKICMCSNR